MLRFTKITLNILKTYEKVDGGLKSFKYTTAFGCYIIGRKRNEA